MRNRLLSSRMIFEGQILSLRVDEVEAPDGHRGTREIVQHGGAVGIVCVHDGDVVLVRQYRDAADEVLLEIPAGLLGEGEEPEACAARELAEEVGLRPRSLEHLATYYAAPGFTTHRLHLYYTDDVEAAPQALEPGEVIEIERRPVETIGALLSSGEIRDAKTLVGLALVALRRS